MTENTLKEKTAKGLMWGTISNGAQLVLGTLFGIFLARILSPSDYGMVGLLTVFSQIASVLQDSGSAQLWPIKEKSYMKTTTPYSGLT